MADLVLAADVGGTKTDLALYSVGDARSLTLVREASFPSRDFGGLEYVLERFLADGEEKVSAAAFGIPGPVVDEIIMTTNLPWRVEARKLARTVGCDRLKLMNDLETTAYGALFLPPDEIETIQAGKPRRGNVAVIAAGTGLGQAFLFWDGKRHCTSGTEGGHADFAPRDEREFELLKFLRKDFPRVSYERIVSGPGLHNVFRFLVEGLGKPVAPEVEARLAKGDDPGAVVGEVGVAGGCPTCAEAVGMFLSVYGAQAGNLALTVMATGGVFIGGGIIVKMLPRVRDGGFLRSFVAKGRYRSVMTEIPVRVIRNPKASRIGAAQAALDLLAP